LVIGADSTSVDRCPERSLYKQIPFDLDKGIFFVIGGHSTSVDRCPKRSLYTQIAEEKQMGSQGIYTCDDSAMLWVPE